MAHRRIPAERDLTDRLDVARVLAAYLEHAAAFSWRDHHCGHFAARWVHARTGRDPLAGLRACGIANAASICRRHGGLAEAVAALTGAREIPHLSAQVGDLVMMQTDGAIGGALGICVGREVAYTTPCGVTQASIMLGCRAWRIEP